MLIADARHLKSKLIASIERRVAQGIEARSLNVPAAPTASLRTPPPSIALGVVRSGKGIQGFKLAVRIQQHSPLVDRQLELIRTQAAGETDERFIGPVRKLSPWAQKRHRPLRIGTSIGHFKITAGTLGCFATARKGNATIAISNNHVLANENAGKAGDAILQPGAYDKGARPKDAIGTLANFVRLSRNTPNLVDAAACLLDEAIQHDPAAIEGLGRLSGLSNAAVDEGDIVHKLGRTTGLTRGRITAFEVDNVRVNFDLGELRFDQQLEIEGADDGPFSQGGDSGSMIVNADLRAVGLLFAGGDVGGSNNRGLTYANPMQSVLEALKADLAGV